MSASFESSYRVIPFLNVDALQSECLHQARTATATNWRNNMPVQKIIRLLQLSTVLVTICSQQTMLRYNIQHVEHTDISHHCATPNSCNYCSNATPTALTQLNIVCLSTCSTNSTCTFCTQSSLKPSVIMNPNMIMSA